MVTDKYYPVTKEELDWIKNDCRYPMRQFCDDCKLAGVYDGDRASGLACKWKGANALMEEVLSRPDPLTLLEAWFKWYCTTHDTSIGLKDATHYMIIQLRTNPSAVREQGIKEGWLP
jgi:hypothetical protein